MNAITEAIKTRAAGKSDAVSAKQLNAMIRDLAEGDQCTQSASVTIKKETQFTGFSQNDPRWSDSTYNSTKSTIGDAGCALCNMASILKLLGYDVTPLTLNNWMMNNHGKNYEYYDNSGRVSWYTVTDYANANIISDPYLPHIPGTQELSKDPMNKGKLIGASIPPETMGETVDTWLENGYYVIAEVKNIINKGKNKGREDRHFVRLEDKENGNYNIYDPGYSDRTTLASYNNQIYKVIIYKVNK